MSTFEPKKVPFLNARNYLGVKNSNSCMLMTVPASYTEHIDFFLVKTLPIKTSVTVNFLVILAQSLILQKFGFCS